MCRSYDDFEWWVDSEVRELAVEPTRCEDCGRDIAVGEPLIRFVAHVEEDSAADDRPWVTVIHSNTFTYKRWNGDEVTTYASWEPGETYHTICDDDMPEHAAARHCVHE